MSVEHEPPLPAWTWRVLGAAAVGLLLLAVAGIALISAGVFDPQPAGPLQETVAPGVVQVAAGERAVSWLPRRAPQAPFSARLRAAHAAGERDAGYGLALGAEGDALFVGVSPLGYVSIWQELPGGELAEHLPWQTWPHVRGGDAPNEIRVDVWEETVTVRLNGELLWQEALDLAPARAALYAESFGQAASVDFQELALFYQAAR